MRHLIATLLLAAAPAFADRLPESSIRLEGSAQLPSEFNAATGFAVVDDCLGREDPTPDDGYPGCLGAFTNTLSGRLLVLSDIPAPGTAARIVVSPTDIMLGLPQKVLGKLGSEYAFDLLYDRGPGHCRIWWTYSTEYVRIAEDAPFLGYSSCDLAKPDPQGLWGFGPAWLGRVDDDPFATAKMHLALASIPDAIAADHFGGLRMALGLGRYQGPRGSSQGPSLYVRAMDVPSVPPSQNGLQDATAVLWYRYANNYMQEWSIPSEMTGGAAETNPMAGARGMEFVRNGAGEALALAWTEPYVVEGSYPCDAEGEAKYGSDPNTADPCADPICWYGWQAYDPSQPTSIHNPSYQEKDRRGANMPPDPKLYDTAMSQGPHCPNRRGAIILYDLDELGMAYVGELGHNVPQPYANIPMPFHPSLVTGGTASDPERGKLYVATTDRNTPVLWIVSTGSPAPPPPPPPPPPIPEPLVLVEHPGFQIDGADPFAEVALVGGFSLHATEWRGCPIDVSRGGDAPFIVAEVTTDEIGQAQVLLTAPPGRTVYVQAVELATCRVSGVVEVTP